jgi:DMSO reductase family type II enzyme heme b subunit
MTARPKSRQEPRPAEGPRRAAWAWAAAAIGAMIAAGCAAPAPPASPSEVLAVRAATLPAGPDDPVWRTAPQHVAPLILQDMVEPRLLTPSTPEVRVQAVTDGSRVAFHLTWPDPTADDLPRAASFGDACAVQLPSVTSPDLPAPQMGEPGKPVEVTYWRAAWQAVVDGRGDTIQDVFPNATVDHYPFEAASAPPGSPAAQEMSRRYAPARAVGNRMAGPRDTPVEDLIAEGPGTLRNAPQQRAQGKGARAEDGWSVVLSRPLPEGLPAGGRTQVAFAVWQGSNQEAGSRKMRTGWIPLAVAPQQGTRP